MTVKKLDVETGKKVDFIDITGKIVGVLKEEGWQSGVCLVYVPHTTCALTINENADPSVRYDIIKKLQELVPERGSYTHSEGNSDAHIKSGLLGHSVSLIIEGGSLRLGTWQGIFLCEFDGPRKRQVWLTFTGDTGRP